MEKTLWNWDDPSIERVVLSECDALFVLELLENPPKPSEALIAATRRYRQPKRKS